MARASKDSPGEELKHRSILSYFRKRIVESVLKPGERLPTRREIGAQFAAGPVTVQRALDLLLNDGFVTADGRRGTFVDRRPPHLFRYGLVMPIEETKGALYNSALEAAAKLVAKEQGIQISLYRDVDGREDVKDYVRLLADAESHRLAGVIFSSDISLLAGSPLWRLSEHRLPRIAMWHPLEDLETIDTDQLGFMQRTVQLASERGCKRIAVIAPARSPAESERVEHHFTQAAAKNHLQLLSRHIQFVNTTTPFTASRTVEGIMSASPEARPDALIIAEDNLVPHAVQGLVSTGLTEKEVAVFAYANFPCPAKAPLPTTNVGFDVSETLRVALGRLRAQAAGEGDSVRTRRAPAILESEQGLSFRSETSEAAE